MHSNVTPHPLVGYSRVSSMHFVLERNIIICSEHASCGVNRLTIPYKTSHFRFYILVNKKSYLSHTEHS